MTAAGPSATAASPGATAASPGAKAASPGATAASPFSRPFDELEVGAAITTPGRTITETDIVSFSALTGDWHPQHSDAAWAAESQFGERIAHGMMVLSYAIGLLPIDPDRVAALRGLRQVVFKRPVPIGETIRVHAKIAETKSLDDAHGMVTLGVQVKSQDGKLLTRASIDALWRREEKPDEAPATTDSGGGGSGASPSELGLDPSNRGHGGNGAESGPDVGELSPVAGGRVLI